MIILIMQGGGVQNWTKVDYVICTCCHINGVDIMEIIKQKKHDKDKTPSRRRRKTLKDNKDVLATPSSGKIKRYF